MDHSQKSPTCITYCYGIGGLDEGLERVIGPLLILCIVEIEAVLIANVVAKMEAGAMAPTLVYSDAKTFPARIFRDRVDWFLAGYPCQPFSSAGKRKGITDSRHLFPYLERDIEAIRPVCCYFENVDDHLTLGFSEVYESLRRLGYAVEAGIFSANEVGAPHERKRLFILAIRFDYLAHCKSECVFRIGSKKLEDTSIIGSDRRHAKRTHWGRKIQTERSGELGNPASRRLKAKHSKSRSLQESNQGRAIRNSKRKGSSIGKGIQANNGKKLKAIERTNSKWPSGPEQPQQAWEHPRLISREAESFVGLSVDGYNFREDFLRAIGNMVVPDCAEKALKTLVEKFKI